MNPPKPTLGRLEPVSLRHVWTNEASDFTPWLAVPENIALLGETIGMDLEVEAQERLVGPFRADILCKETLSGDWVLIENQLERTDHIHLGQIVTYAAGLEAKTIIWIASRFTEEHRAALDWLNEITGEEFRFFGIAVEAWRIGDSPPAPRFHVISSPNDWSRQVRSGAKQVRDGELTESKQLQLEFWERFRTYAEEHAECFRPINPMARPIMPIAIGRSGFHLLAVASLTSSETGGFDQNELRAELLIKHPDHAEGAYQQLLAERSSIEAELGERLHWYEAEGVRRRRMALIQVADLRDRSQWPKYFRWLTEKLDKLHRAFHPRVKALELRAREE